MNRFFNVSQDSGISQSPCNYQTPPPLPPKKKSSSPTPPPQHQLTMISQQQRMHPGSWRVQQRHRVEVQRNSILSSDDEEDIIEQEFRARQVPPVIMNEPFPAELDFAQIIGRSQFNASQPPPPPPRDPRRRLYLSPDTRPMSYSFEKPDVVQKVPTSQTDHEPPALIRPQHKIIKDQRQGRTASASSYFSHSVPDLVRPAEYWKSPPPPYVPTYDPYLQPQQQPPPRPPRPNLKKKLSDTSSRGRDSAIGPSPAMMMSNGKSSPSSSSVTSSRDSGYPGHPAAGQLLSAVDETNAQVSAEEEISVIHCEENDEEESETESYSPPRTNESHPGFSSKGRRSLFREAMNEIEDAFNQIQTDVDLLDRAERRDLPTAHQELIAQGRLQDDCPTTSLNTSTEMLFSDMDNFMNWNTSSSFENIPEQRQRTPARRRSGKPDKIADDMVQRLCRDHNKPVGSEDPGVKLNQSYLLLSPALTPASSQAHLQTDPDEPDIVLDDMSLRRRLETHQQPSGPEPPFGIPKVVLSRSSSKDYLHAIPDLARYKSTFNAMKNPDTVLDDLAYRALRKDSNPSHPESLGIVKDPNRPVSAHSCWKHKMEAKLKNGHGNEAKQFPAVFYPKRNKVLLEALANDISLVAKRSSQTPNGGKEAKVITYEDLIQDPEVMQSMKQSLGITDDPQELKDTKEWSGKTLYQLLSNPGNPGPGAGPRSSQETANQKTEDILVQHCTLETRPVLDTPGLPFNNDEKKGQEHNFTLLVEPQHSSVLRNQERLDSGSEEQSDLQCCQGNVQVWLLENPALLAACYCLALLHQFNGLDFMSLLGMILACISMISCFFL